MTAYPERLIGSHVRRRLAVVAAALRDALERLRLEGAVFLRAEYREPWTYESLPARPPRSMLRPGTDRVVLFHVVASGTCWVAVDGGRSTGRRPAT